MESLYYLAIIWGSVFAAAFLSARTRLTPVLYFLAALGLWIFPYLLAEQQALTERNSP